MSRIGKQPIRLPAKVEVKIEGQEVTIKGPKGELKHTIHPAIGIQMENGVVHITRSTDERQHRALHGLTRALIANMVTGVSTGFSKTLLIEGVGYQADMRGQNLVLKLGFSHEVVVEPPANIKFEVPADRRGTMINIHGIDKQTVGQVAANIRELRPPEPYKGKGIRYDDEIIRRKAGKAGKK